jgi:peroxiredoxin
VPRHGLIGPFTGRQLLFGTLAVIAAAVILVIITTPLGSTGLRPGALVPRATAYVIGSPPPDGLQAGMTAPELAVTLPDQSTYRLVDVDGKPVRLTDLRGKVVWLNFFATWCPPCQQEMPILRDLSERYRSRGLEIVGISVQETTPTDVGDYRDRYQLPYTIGFDGSGYIRGAYRVWALPTQFFIDPNGAIVQVVQGPVDDAGASALIEALLPSPSPQPSASLRPSPTR